MPVLEQELEVHVHRHEPGGTRFKEDPRFQTVKL
jgi:hypothetical protein